MPRASANATTHAICRFKKSIQLDRQVGGGLACRRMDTDQAGRMGGLRRDMEHSRELLGAHDHRVLHVLAALKERVIEELAAAIGLDNLTAIQVLLLFSADLPWVVIESFQPRGRIDAVPSLGRKRLKEGDKMANGIDIEMLRPRDIDAARADIKTELRGIAVDCRHLL